MTEAGVVNLSGWISRLEALPEDLSTIPDPVFNDRDDARCALKKLLGANPSPSRRHTVLQAAAKLPPHDEWETTALEWADDDGPEDLNGADVVVNYISLAMSQGVFHSERWLQALIDGGGPRIAASLERWGAVDCEAFLAACEQAMARPTSRILVVNLVLTVLLSVAYVPGTSAASTTMALVAEHSFLISLIRSLLLDTGNTLFPVALRCLLTIIPYAPHAFNGKVPLLMIIFGRAACWRDRPFVDTFADGRDGVTRTRAPNPDLRWTVETSSVESPTDQPMEYRPNIISRLLSVTVYNAWPSNVLAFLRDPASYLQGKGTHPVYDASWVDVWEPGLLRARAEPLLRNFHLHPSLINFSSTAELADEKRWDRNDPSEFVARSHMLAHSELLAGDRYDFLEGAPLIGPGLGPVDSFDTSRDNLGIPSENQSDFKRLKREIQLLRLEARSVDRIRKQYLYHVGRLHKHALRFNSDEAEIHSFVNRLKEQGKTITTLTAELSQQRVDASQAQQKHLKWQQQLRDKVTAYREEKKDWQTDAAWIRGELSETQATVQRQEDELAVVKNERFKLQNKLTEIGPKIQHIEDYEVRMKQLIDSQRLWDDDIQRYKDACRQAESWRARCYQLDQMLRCGDRKRDEQAESIRRLETSLNQERLQRAPSPAKLTVNQSLPDAQSYLNIIDNTRRRVESLERDNLDLSIELERLREAFQATQAPGDRSFIWGG